MTTKEINRNISFSTRKPGSKYRCNYGNRNAFELLRINIKLEGIKSETYEIDAENLPSTTDSISFNARPANDGFEVFGWTKSVRPFIRKIEA
ncbi:MAG: hypothetical protein K2M56_02370 [Muribaculaceae bacterium]|nr:hypothetical protein [Muribaculaceae bacterium]